MDPDASPSLRNDSSYEVWSQPGSHHHRKMNAHGHAYPHISIGGHAQVHLGDEYYKDQSTAKGHVPWPFQRRGLYQSFSTGESALRFLDFSTRLLDDTYTGHNIDTRSHALHDYASAHLRTLEMLANEERGDSRQQTSSTAGLVLSHAVMTSASIAKSLAHALQQLSAQDVHIQYDNFRQGLGRLLDDEHLSSIEQALKDIRAEIVLALALAVE